MKLIVGLGNVGAQYAHTRHNLGFMVLDELANLHELRFSANQKLATNVAKGRIGKHEVVLAKPITMMNLSGEAVQRLMQFYKLKPTDVWIIHDELDLEFGLLRIRQAGGAAGHNGIRSITEAVGADTLRWRIGVGRPTGQMEAAAFVLANFNETEQAKLPQIIKAVVDKIEEALQNGHNITSEQLVR